VGRLHEAVGVGQHGAEVCPIEQVSAGLNVKRIRPGEPWTSRQDRAVRAVVEGLQGCI